MGHGVRGTVIISSVLLVFIFFLTERAQPASAAPYGGKLILSSGTDPKTFNPITAQETSSTSILRFIFEGLTRTDPHTGGVISHMAASWKVDESGLVWTFYLHKNIRWNDGEPCTANDVVFTFNDIIYNPNIITSLRSIFLIDGKPIEVTALDTYTVQFRLPTRFAPFLRSLSTAIMPEHALRESVRNETFNEMWSVGDKLEHIVGTGPFMLERYIPGETVYLRKNPYYWQKDTDDYSLPYLDGIIIPIIQSEDLALLKFKNSEIDVYSLRGVDYPWLKPLEKEGTFKLYDLGPTMSRFFLVFNENTGTHPQTNEPYLSPEKISWFTNQHFRQAIAYCINKKEIADLVYNGLAIPQDASMSPASGYFYNNHVPTYPYDIKRARELLAEEGFWDRDNDGILEDAKDYPVSLSLYTSAGNPLATQLANLVRKDISQVGCEVNLIQVEFNTLVNKLLFSFDWDIVLMGLTGGIDPHFGSNVWRSGGPLHMWYPREEKPATAWEARVDEIFSEAVQELDRKKRKKLYDEWQDIIAREAPVIYTVIPTNILGVNTRVHNLDPSPFGGVLHNVEQLYVEGDHGVDY